MKKFRKLLAVLAIAIFTFTACSIEGQDTKDNSSNTKKEEKAKDGKLKVGVSLSTLNNPFFVSIREGVEEAAKDKDVETVITDAQNDSSTQNNQVEDLITQKVDLIIINPVDSTAISSSVKKANEANIPVICVDRGSDEGEIVSFIASNNVEGGKLAG